MLEYYVVLCFSDVNEAEDHWHTVKSFRMLEHICEHHLHKYRWFLRSVDDAYVNVAKLRHFLTRQDSTKKVTTADS